ncbi:hypothetical protein HYPSUDRAFT_204232 [Hypholoma sublateritium FD-334 SS-4]|uniref:Uncharacterized protein n=1 Tax=Hypholoma sublateritium (strain FD-334 SS-4) TaxID=945553 RepID=A0A0D2PIE0_HYPSF|nr:hypothetical protein HYPSUDRAFT_204232 [Hypholoma sublateritium FD-334 SS-4]
MPGPMVALSRRAGEDNRVTPPVTRYCVYTLLQNPILVLSRQYPASGRPSLLRAVRAGTVPFSAGDDTADASLAVWIDVGIGESCRTRWYALMGEDDFLRILFLNPLHISIALSFHSPIFFSGMSQSYATLTPARPACVFGDTESNPLGLLSVFPPCTHFDLAPTFLPTRRAIMPHPMHQLSTTASTASSTATSVNLRRASRRVPRPVVRRALRGLLAHDTASAQVLGSGEQGRRCAWK